MTDVRIEAQPADVGMSTFFVSPAEDLFMVFMTQLRAAPATYPIRRELRAAIYGAIND
jgi:hypothetical protein